MYYNLIKSLSYYLLITGISLLAGCQHHNQARFDYTKDYYDQRQAVITQGFSPDVAQTVKRHNDEAVIEGMIGNPLGASIVESLLLNGHN